MNARDDGQQDLDFGASAGADGYKAWHRQRRAAVQRLGQELGLPFGYEVEVWLKGGVRLRGELRLREELLFVDSPRDLHLDLVVDGVMFRLGEMESCVRLD